MRRQEHSRSGDFLLTAGAVIDTMNSEMNEKGERTMYSVAAQTFGILGMIMNVSSYQIKHRRGVVFMQLFGSIFFTINMFMLGASSGFLLNVIGIGRGLIYSSEKRMKHARVWNAVFVALYVLSYVSVFLLFGKEMTLRNAVLELLPTLGMTVSTISFACPAAVIRRCTLISAPCWLIYHSVSHSIGGVICELFGLASVAAGMLRLDRSGKKAQEK